MSGKLFRDSVIGFVVTEIRSENAREGGFIMVRPIAMDYEGLINDEDLILEGADAAYEAERVIGVIPAAPGTYQTWGVVDDADRCEPLGYEFPGVDHPEREEVRQALMQKNRKRGGVADEARD